MTKISLSEIVSAKRWPVPPFVVRWLERVIRQRELNYVLEKYADASPMEFLRGFFDYAGVTYEAVGLERLDVKGRYIFAANHPFGGMDGMMLAEVIGSHFGDVRVVVNDLLMYLDPLKPIFVPVNKSGAQRGSYAVMMREVFAGDVPVLTFPAGLCSRRFPGGEICDLQWRPNFVKRAIQTGRQVVPVYVEGRLSNRFYRVAAWRKRLGLRFNLEQILLPSEMFSQKGGHFRLVFGEAIPAEELCAMGDNLAAAQEVKRRVYDLHD